MIITAAWLTEREACRDQVETFEAEWPGGAELNETNIRRALELHLDLDWLARKVLRGQARREYGGALDLALAEYKRATAPAWAEYQRVIAQALAEYERATAPAWAEYKRAIAPAQAECKRAVAQALISALALEEVENVD